MSQQKAWIKRKSGKKKHKIILHKQLQERWKSIVEKSQDFLKPFYNWNGFSDSGFECDDRVCKTNGVRGEIMLAYGGVGYEAAGFQLVDSTLLRRQLPCLYKSVQALQKTSLLRWKTKNY